MATDWAKVKLAYINSSKTLREVADDHGIKAAGVMARAAKEAWEAERKQKSAEVSKAAQAAMTIDRATELAKFNDDDLRVAKGLRGIAAQMLKEDRNFSPADLRALAGTFETAQRIGRLALGAETEMSVVKTQELPASIDEFV